ncbi:hypothetical protein [Planctellipticum variicoloris]|uniref:hypothetical protein n=1 Tax=Planctellipticum variicoloris TaxID=3064265 RepID=UPI0030140355|nr:hypothetical protein SH412_005325 [Planctomycetaceae bacterium SH412]
MPSNFAFLPPHWAGLHDDASQAEGNVDASPWAAAQLSWTIGRNHPNICVFRGWLRQ